LDIRKKNTFCSSFRWSVNNIFWWSHNLFQRPHLYLYEAYNNKYNIIDLNNYFNEFFYFNWNEFCVEWNNKGKELFLQLIELGKLIKESGGKSQIYAAKPRNDKFDQIICWIEEINKRLNSKNVIKFIYDISKDDLLSKYFYNENISKEINKNNLKLDFSKFNLLQDKIYKIKEGFFTEFVRIFTQLAYIK